MYAAELPEWKQEKNRFYCEVPGDIWEEGVFMRLIKQNQEERVSRLSQVSGLGGRLIPAGIVGVAVMYDVSFEPFAHPRVTISRPGCLLGALPTTDPTEV